jgi:hypothetical protein
MHPRIRVTLIMLVMMVLAAPFMAGAAVVGRFTLVTGQVDLLKGGKTPGIPVKVQDGVEAGDVIRTKAKAKAQLTMVDDSVISLAPESRLALADYQYDPARGERRAMVRLFRGLVHTVVSRIIKAEEPDFIMETHTAIIGVRGTDWYTLLGPNFTSVYLPRGILGVQSNLPSIPALVLLRSRQFTRVLMGQPPYTPQDLPPETLKMLEHLMDTGLIGDGLGFGVPSLPGTEGQFPLALPSNPDRKILQQTIPPVLVPHHQVPAPVQPAPVQPAPTGPGPTGGPGTFTTGS